MKEIWKDIKGFEGLYQVSNLGNVKSFRQSSKYGKPKEFLLKPSVANTGYCQITLYGNGSRKKLLVHRLVAEAFLENPDNLPNVNHKDENRTNNCVSNLEWCTTAYNNRYGTARIRGADKMRKPVCQYTYENVLIAKYRSAGTASEITGIPRKRIQAACRRHSLTNGCYWEYCQNL